jgi:hypothetical protein
MISRKTIALSMAVIAVSASAAMAATTHPRHERPVQQRAYNADEARASYAAADPRGFTGTHYYGADDNGSVWSFYPGYVPMAHN